MIERDLKAVLLQRAREFPVVTVTGPRQSGKTTLVRDAFPGHAYANLEDPETRELAAGDYHRFLATFPPPVIIDEIQRVPDLASAIQVAVDANRAAKGAFILTGSCQPGLKRAVSQSLAGRSAFLKLLPLSFAEQLRVLPMSEMTVDACILRGSMPELAAGVPPPPAYYRNYLQAYLERDVRQVGEIRQMGAFNRFLVLLAGRVGQLLNLNSLSDEVGASHTTLAGWLDMLEASFVVFRLRPYHANVGKRMVKTPKVYFYETGLAACLLGFKTVEQVSRDPLRGSLFENLVVTDLLKLALNQDEEGDLFFFRTSDGHEVDVVRRRQVGWQPIEIKSAETYSDALLRGLEKFRRLVPNAVEPTLLYAGKTLSGAAPARVANFLDFD